MVSKVLNGSNFINRSITHFLFINKIKPIMSWHVSFVCDLIQKLIIKNAFDKLITKNTHVEKLENKTIKKDN